jgi:hypothetical protein
MTRWSADQRYRIAFEENLLNEQGFDHFAFEAPTEAAITTVRGTHRSTSGKAYHLAVWLGQHYPSRMPGLYVLAPEPLIGYGGKRMVDYGLSHAMHTWATEWGSYVKICHCKAEFWSAAVVLVEVLLKGTLWLEAYEAHCRTGLPIDAYSLTYGY